MKNYLLHNSLSKNFKQYLIFIIFISFTIFQGCHKPTYYNPTQPLVQSTTDDIRLTATSVTLSDAIPISINFLQNKNHNQNISIKNAVTIEHNGKPYFHIINATQGFVILSSDSMYAPILAYDSINNFSYAPEDLNPGIRMWMNNEAYQLDWIRSEKTALNDSIGKVNKTLWNAIIQINKLPSSNPHPEAINVTGNAHPNVLPPVLISSVPYGFLQNIVVGPLCATHWDQNPPFNQYCPTFSGSPAPTGCVPTAMSQVMYFWKYPTNNSSYSWPPCLYLILHFCRHPLFPEWQP
jgi:hypothetical protein